MFSDWRRVCGSPSQAGGGKYSHWRRCVWGGYRRGAEFSKVTAAGKKLFLNLLVREQRTL